MLPITKASKMKINSEYKTEAEIQSDLRYRLINLGYNVYLERNFEIPDFKKTRTKKRTSKIRVDVTVCDKKDNIICVIEVKNHTRDNIPLKSRQFNKYKALKLPFKFCLNDSYIKETIDWVNKIYQVNQELY